MVPHHRRKCSKIRPRGKFKLSASQWGLSRASPSPLEKVSPHFVCTIWSLESTELFVRSFRGLLAGLPILPDVKSDSSGDCNSGGDENCFWQVEAQYSFPTPVTLDPSTDSVTEKLPEPTQNLPTNTRCWAVPQNRNDQIRAEHE